jgi:hypothetical protein
LVTNSNKSKRNKERNKEINKERDKETKEQRKKKERKGHITCRKKSATHSKDDTSNDVLPTKSKGSNVDHKVNYYQHQSHNPFIAGFSA